MMGRKDPQNITLRLGGDILDKLDEIARTEHASVSVVASRGLRRQVEWEGRSARYGFQSWTRQLLSKLIEYVPNDEEVRKLGRWMSENTFRELTAYFFGNEELENALAVFELLATYGRRFKYELHVSGRNRTVVLKHDMGHKWSILYEEVLKTRLGDFFGKGVEKINTYRTENQVVAEFSCNSALLGGRGPD